MHVLHCLLYQIQIQPEPNLINRIVLFVGLLVCLMAIAFLFFIIISRHKQNGYVKEKDRLRQSFQQQLILAQTEVQEATLTSLSKELHDNIGQLLGTAKILLGVAQRNPAANNETLQTAEQTLGTAIQELRTLSKTLNKDWLEQFSFFDNLHTEIARINATQQHQVALNNSLQNIPFSPQQQLIVFRIVQEAINNACRHGHAAVITIQAKMEGRDIIINITDNGKGFDATIKNKGMGLINMQHRANLLQGRLYIDTGKSGTTVQLIIPTDINHD
jgi:signal transduction histidine kinase